MGKFFLTFKFQKERAINYFLQNQGTKILTSSIDSLNKGEKKLRPFSNLESDNGPSDLVRA